MSDKIPTLEIREDHASLLLDMACCLTNGQPNRGIGTLMMAVALLINDLPDTMKPMAEADIHNLYNAAAATIASGSTKHFHIKHNSMTQLKKGRSV